MPSLPVVIAPTGGMHTATLIFLHGLGDSGHGWSSSLRVLCKKFPSLKVICPHATNRRVTLNGGMAMPAWYDIFSLEAGEGREDKAGLDESAQVVRALVKGEEEAGIPASRILIGGFSQGGAVALYTVLTASHDAPPARRLAGVISLSAYVPCAKEIAPAPEEAGPAVAARLPPVFMAHGSADLVVKYDWHRKSVSFLTDRIGMALTPSRPARGGELTVKVYKGMAHCACSEEIDDVATFVASCLDA